MKSNRIYWAVSALLLATSTFAAPPSHADSQNEVKPVAEPYEPGSSAVLNEWHFSPGEPTTIASNFRSHQHNSGRCRNSHHHHSPT